MVLASIVTEETNKKDEMPLHRRRLHQPPAQGDAAPGRSDREIRAARLRTEAHSVQTPENSSPYNTYILIKDSPPSVICMPELAAIDAVLLYGEHDYPLFCARPRSSGYRNFGGRSPSTTPMPGHTAMR